MAYVYPPIPPIASSRFGMLGGEWFESLAVNFEARSVFSITALLATTFAALDGFTLGYNGADPVDNALNGGVLVLPAGMTIYGAFKRINLTAGKVVVYTRTPAGGFDSRYVTPNECIIEPSRFGQCGADFIDDLLVHDGDWCAIMATVAATFTQLDSNTMGFDGAAPAVGGLDGRVLPANITIYGRFQRIQLGAGAVIAYHAAGMKV